MSSQGLPFVYFLYGLAFFAMGLSVALESRWASALAFGHHLRWLAAFGLVHSLVAWSDMFLFIVPGGPAYDALVMTRTLLLPISAVLLVRFGIGLAGEAGPLPRPLLLFPSVLLVPGALLFAYLIIIIATEPAAALTIDAWSRYLLYFPGSLLASFGLFRQWRRLPAGGFSRGRKMLLGAAAAFLFNGLVCGLVVPQGPQQLIPWLSQEQVLAATGIPIQFWRMLAALTIAFFVVRALGIFKVEREQQIANLNRTHSEAQQQALQMQTSARQVAEEWIDGLVGVSQQVANIEDVNAVLASITALARRLLASDTAALALWDDSGERLELKCCATGEPLGKTHTLRVDNPMILRTLHAGQAQCYPEDGNHSQWLCPVTGQAYDAAAVVPLQVDGRPIGGLWVARSGRGPYGAGDLAGLARLGAQAVIALEHALMEARLQSLAVVEERGRLAREMHDGLSQILGFLSLQMQTLEALVKQGERESTLAELTEARARIKAAQADVRDNILSLRTTLAGDAGLLPSLQQYVEEFGHQAGVQAELVSALGEPPRLSPLAETQLVRIVQEALANVRKHAQAQRVTVHLEERAGALQVSISDNGVGFKDGPDRTHFGLSTMRERAEDVGGTLRVTSRPGAGTRVRLSLPLLEMDALRVAA